MKTSKKNKYGKQGLGLCYLYKKRGENIWTGVPGLVFSCLILDTKINQAVKTKFHSCTTRGKNDQIYSIYTHIVASTFNSTLHLTVTGKQSYKQNIWNENLLWKKQLCAFNVKQVTRSLIEMMGVQKTNLGRPWLSQSQTRCNDSGRNYQGHYQ